MIKQKQIKTLGLLFSLLVFGVASSCSSTDEVSENSVIENLKHNKWISRDVSSGVGNNDHAWVDFETNTLYFTSDNAGVAYWLQKDYDSDLGNSRNYDYGDFSYSVNGRMITLSSEYGTSELKYEDNFLSFNGGMYQKAAMSSGDYDLLKRISPKTGSCGEGLTYTFYPKTNGLEISGNGRMNDYTTSNQPWKDFYVQSVSIDEGCTYVGKNAFADEIHVTSVSLPRTLVEIGENAFSGTTISSISIPENVRTIGDGAFLGCKYLGSVYLSKNLVTVGSGAFSGCAIKYHNLRLPDNVETVGDNAFSGWQAGTLTLNDKLKTVGKGAFVGVKGTLTIPNSVESIDFLAFDGTFNKIVIGSGLKHLSRSAFVGSSSGGNMYVNLGIPLKLENPLAVDDEIFAEDYVQSKWNLYVPKGSKSAYASDLSWKKFKNIYEDASLISGNGMLEESGVDSGSGETKPVTGTTQGHEWVDLELPSGTKWATMNVGASKRSDAGTYYMFAQKNPDVTGHPNVTKKLPDCTGAQSSYNIAGNAEYDLARMLWGSSWKMPLQEQVQELEANCTASWYTENGVAGILYTSKKNGGTLFFPITGYKATELDNLPYMLTNSNNGYFWLGQYFASKDYSSNTYKWVYGAYYFSNKSTKLLPTSFSVSSWHNAKLPVRAVTK